MQQKDATTRKVRRRSAPPPPPAISVIVVDDHRTFADALRIAVGLEGGLEVHVVSDGEQAIDLVERIHPDVVLMDVEMPRMGGLEATRRIHETDPDTRVIVLSSHDDDLVRARAVDAGAVGFLSKFSPMDQVGDAVRRAYKGETLIERQEVNRLLRRLRKQRNQDATQRQRTNRLTPRHVEILQLMADGLSSAEISARLGMSPQTLRTHLQNVLMRLDVHTKVEALAMAIRQGVVTSRPGGGV